MKIILASSSPRRKQLMKELNLDFEIIVKEVDETYDISKNIYEQGMEVAKRKAIAVFNDILDDVIVISCDTIVYQNGIIYGKPKDYNDAVKMLETFSDNHHEVISFLCMLIRKNGQVYQELTYDEAIVYFDKLEKNEIDEWINNNDVYSKAGAYAVQESFGKHIKKIEGDYYSIVGLPINKLYNLLKKYL